jgi:hypothetical protein
VSKHLKVLERAGLIARSRDAQWRPCRLDAEPLKDAASWIEEYRRFWVPYVDALERYLDRTGQPAPAKEKTGKKRRDAKRKRDKGEAR